MKLHENSLTIPRSELAGFLGSDWLAKKCAAELNPAVKRHKILLFDRGEVHRWYDRFRKSPDARSR